jgi:flagellar basal-body rod protein FlgB
MLSTTTSDFFDLAERKLDWIDQRTRVLAGNVANADTPGFRPRDLQPFARSLSPFQLDLARTDAADIAAPNDAGPAAEDITTEQSPDGNGVSLEHQMKLVADTNAQQQLTTTLYRKYLGLTMTALGAGASS